VLYVCSYQPLAIGLVFERFDTDVRQFLKMWPLKVAGMRRVLRIVLAALAYMHELGLVHANFKPANILLRGAGAFQDGWRRLIGRAMGLIPGGGAELASGAA
jgi:serine/threonine protein kinase